jgi:hypothetical protein
MDGKSLHPIFCRTGGCKFATHWMWLHVAGGSTRGSSAARPVASVTRHPHRARTSQNSATQGSENGESKLVAWVPRDAKSISQARGRNGRRLLSSLSSKHSVQQQRKCLSGDILRIGPPTAVDSGISDLGYPSTFTLGVWPSLGESEMSDAALHEYAIASHTRNRESSSLISWPPGGHLHSSESMHEMHYPLIMSIMFASGSPSCS